MDQTSPQAATTFVQCTDRAGAICRMRLAIVALPAPPAPAAANAAPAGAGPPGGGDFSGGTNASPGLVYKNLLILANSSGFRRVPGAHRLRRRHRGSGSKR